MRDSVPWMGGLDEQILERLANDGDADAWEIAFDIWGRVSQGRMSDRCEVLADAELVEQYECEIVDGRYETYWSITTWGEFFERGCRPQSRRAGAESAAAACY